MNSQKWSVIHRQNNLEPLHEHGSYFRFLNYGEARNFYYGQSLAFTSNEKDWKWLENKISGEILMGSEFFSLSNKFANGFKELGIEIGDVIHMITGSHIDTLPIIGGLWTLGAICSLSPMTTDFITIEKQVSE